MKVLRFDEYENISDAPVGDLGLHGHLAVLAAVALVPLVGGQLLPARSGRAGRLRAHARVIALDVRRGAPHLQQHSTSHTQTQHSSTSHWNPAQHVTHRNRARYILKNNSVARHTGTQQSTSNSESTWGQGADHK